MRALLRTILGLFVALSLGMGAVAPAGEALLEGPVGMCVEGAVHERDDESRDSDAAKWGLHAHGGCHGHHQADALARTGDALPPPVRSLNFAAGTDFLA